MLPGQVCNNPKNTLRFIMNAVLLLGFSPERRVLFVSPWAHKTTDLVYEAAVFAIPTDLGISYNIIFTKMQIKKGSQSYLIW